MEDYDYFFYVIVFFVVVSDVKVISLGINEYFVDLIFIILLVFIVFELL